jgi:hypothetical protein
VQQPREAHPVGGVAGAARALGEGIGQPGLSNARRANDDQKREGRPDAPLSDRSFSRGTPDCRSEGRV